MSHVNSHKPSSHFFPYVAVSWNNGLTHLKHLYGTRRQRYEKRHCALSAAWRQGKWTTCSNSRCSPVNGKCSEKRVSIEFWLNWICISTVERGKGKICLKNAFNVVRAYLRFGNRTNCSSHLLSPKVTFYVLKTFGGFKLYKRCLPMG